MKKWITLIVGIILIGSYIHYFPSEETKIGEQANIMLKLISTEEIETQYAPGESAYYHDIVYPPVTSMVQEYIKIVDTSVVFDNYCRHSYLHSENTYRYFVADYHNTPIKVTLKKGENVIESKTISGRNNSIYIPNLDAQIIVSKCTPTTITFQSDMENFLQYYDVIIYDANSQVEKQFLQKTAHTFEVSGLTPNTRYLFKFFSKEVYTLEIIWTVWAAKRVPPPEAYKFCGYHKIKQEYSIIGSDEISIDITTPKKQETLDIIPLGTEKTSNSFVQVYKVTGENVNQKIQLKHGDKVRNYEPQFDGKNYYVVFDGLETGDYEYTITVYNATEEKRYSNSFHIQNVENPSGIDLDVEPARIDQNSFYLRFRVKGTDDYEAYFEYLNEDTFEVKEAEINHGVRYDDVYLKNLEEGDYSYNLIISTEEGTIEHKGTFTIRKEEQPTYIPPYTSQSEKKSIFPYLVVIIIIFLITYIFIKPKIINSKKRRR